MRNFQRTLVMFSPVQTKNRTPCSHGFSLIVQEGISLQRSATIIRGPSDLKRSSRFSASTPVQILFNAYDNND